MNGISSDDAKHDGSILSPNLPFAHQRTRAGEAKTPAEAAPQLYGPPLYPMYVMNSRVFGNLGTIGLPVHEDAMKMLLLLEVVEVRPGKYTTHKCSPDGTRGEVVDELLHRACFVAVSHQWFRPNRDPVLAHPDSEEHLKFTSLKQYCDNIERDKKDNWKMDETYLWMDYFSIPQDPHSRASQVLAIKSLPSYFMYASTVLVLSPSRGCFDDHARGHLSRGHCLMELSTSKLPRIDVNGKWYVPGYEENGMWGSQKVLFLETMEVEVLTWPVFQAAGSPLEGKFTVAEDRELMRPLMEAYIAAFESFDAQCLAPLRGIVMWEDLNPRTKTSKEVARAVALVGWHVLRAHKSRFASPRAFAEHMLPSSYASILSPSTSSAVTTTNSSSLSNLHLGEELRRVREENELLHRQALIGTELQREVVRLKDEVKGLKEELAETKEEVSILRSRLQGMEQSPHQKKIRNVAACFQDDLATSDGHTCHPPKDSRSSNECIIS